MLQQFPLPRDTRTTAEEEAAEMGELTLRFITESYSAENPLSLKQRTILARFCLSTMNGKATQVGQIRREIAAKTKQQATFLAGSLKQRLKTKEIDGHPVLQTRAVRSPKQRAKIGYCLEIVRPATEEQKTKTAESETSTAEIVKRLEEIHQALLTQLQTVDQKKETMPMDDEAERQVILSTIEDIGKEVEQALAITWHGLGEDKKDIIKILLEASQRCEAIMPSAIAEKTGKSQEEISAIMDRLQFTLKRSPVINLAVRAQRDPQHSHSFGYYIGLKQEPQKSPGNPTLPALTFPLSKDKKQMFMSLVDRAVKQTRPKARLVITIFKALKTASAAGTQITPEYCQAIASRLFKETYQLRAFEEKLIKMQEIPEDKFGFRIERTGLKTWQPVPSTDQEILRPILEEMEEQDEIAAIKNPAELKKRVDAGLKHLNIKDQASLQAVFDVLTKAYTTDQGLSMGEIAERSKFESERKIDEFLRRVGKVNKKMPTMLGFEVVAAGADRYSLALTNNYIPAEIKFSGHAAACPIPVEKETNFKRTEFDKIIASPKNRKAGRIAPRTRIALGILASHSEKGEAVSAPYLENKTSKNTGTRNGRSQDLVRTIKNFLKRLEDGKMSLLSHKLHTWYLSIDEPATQTPPEPQQARATQQAKTTQTASQPAKTQGATRRKPQQRPAGAQPKPPKPARTTRQQTSTFDYEDLFLDIEEGYGAVVGEKVNHLAMEEEHDDDDNERPHLKETPLMTFQRDIIDIAARLLVPETATLRSLLYFQKRINELDTKKQPILIKAQQDYLAKLNRVIKAAEREIETALRKDPNANGVVPLYLTEQLYSV